MDVPFLLWTYLPPPLSPSLSPTLPHSSFSLLIGIIIAHVAIRTLVGEQVTEQAIFSAPIILVVSFIEFLLDKLLWSNKLCL